eukprot:6196447-Alexandrium_andersonii.AAC.1
MSSSTRARPTTLLLQCLLEEIGPTQAIHGTAQRKNHRRDRTGRMQKALRASSVESRPVTVAHG